MKKFVSRDSISGYPPSPAACPMDKSRCRIRQRGKGVLPRHRHGRCVSEPSSAMANLLLVDDDGDLIETLAEVLRRAGHDVRTAGDGQQGLRALHDASLPDVVVLD